ERRPLDSEADVPDDDHGALRTRDIHREIDDDVRFRRSGDNRTIGAEPARQIAHDRFQFIWIARPGVQSEVARAADARRVEIVANDAAPRSLQQLRRELADQTQADDGDTLAKLWTRPANALHRNRAKRRRSRVLE